jgi:hypothetical protein
MIEISAFLKKNIDFEIYLIPNEQSRTYCFKRKNVGDISKILKRILPRYEM